MIIQAAEQCCHLVGICSPLGVQPGRSFRFSWLWNKVEGHHGSTGLFLPLPVQVHDAPLPQDQRLLGLSFKTRGRLGNTHSGRYSQQGLKGHLVSSRIKYGHREGGLCKPIASGPFLLLLVDYDIHPLSSPPPPVQLLDLFQHLVALFYPPSPCNQQSLGCV